MSIRVTGVDTTSRKIKKVSKTLSGLENDIFKYDFKSGMIKRIKSGLDIHLKPFVSYSAEYKKQKLKNNYKSYNGVVNMILNFHMLASIARKKISGGVRYYFNNKKEEDKAYAHQKGLGDLPERKFFGIDKKERNKFFKKFKRKIKIQVG